MSVFTLDAGVTCPVVEAQLRIPVQVPVPFHVAIHCGAAEYVLANDCAPQVPADIVQVPWSVTSNRAVVVKFMVGNMTVQPVPLHISWSEVFLLSPQVPDAA